MAHGVDHHERALPAIGAKAPPDPAALEVPMGQLLLEPLLDFGIAISAFGRCHRPSLLKELGDLPFNRSIARGFGPINGALSPSVETRKGVGAPARGDRHRDRAASFRLSRSKWTKRPPLRLVRALARCSAHPARALSR